MLYPLSYEGGDGVCAGQRVVRVSERARDERLVPNPCPMSARHAVSSTVRHETAARASWLVSVLRG
jgi:hypothetical protein